MVNIVNRTNHNLHDIPSELREFLKNDTYSLLVKGLSGTGKTTFSLSILRSLKAKNNFFYISTRSRSEEHTSELQSLMRISYAVFCLKKKTYKKYLKHYTTS